MSLLVETRPAELDTPSPDIAAEMFLLRFEGNTAAAYRNDLRVFGAWLDELGISPFDADRNTIQLFVKGMQGRAPATVARRLACLSSFYRFLEEEKLVESNPLAGVRRPNGSGTPVSGLGKHELRSLLRAAADSGVQEHALCLLLALNGLRIAEVLGLDVADMGSERGFHTVVVRRKGNVQQRVPLAPVTWQAVRQLIEEENDVQDEAAEAGSGRASGPLQAGEGSRVRGLASVHQRHDPVRGDRQGPGQAGHELCREDGERGARNGKDVRRVPLFEARGERLDRFQAFRIIRRLAAQAGVREISPHSLRSAFITLSREAGAPLEDVQDACGHASPVTTRSYDRARYMLERNPTHVLATFIGEVAE